MEACTSSYKIILGSSSVARRNILSEMGYEFTIMTADIDEKSIRKETPEELVMALAEAKAEAIVQRLPVDDYFKDAEPTLLITCDQLKICRGSSVRKILVREANANSATHIIVGIPQGLHKIRPGTTVAKYCAKKLSKECWVLAVNNGKVVFKRDGSPATRADFKGIEWDHRKGLLGSIHWTLNKSSKVINDESTGMHDKGIGQISDHSLAKVFLDSTELTGKKSCSICGPTPALPNSSCLQTAEESSTDVNENSLAIVPLQTTGAVSSTTTLHGRKLPELKPGWPLLHRAILSDTNSTGRSLLRQISVVQWAMRLPCRNLSYSADHDLKTNNCDQYQDQSLALDSKSGALVPVDAEIGRASSLERNSRSIAKELEGLHEKYSSTCRLFKYQELASATSNFSTENLIGKGGCSKVYRGCLPDGKELAVKILKPSDDVLKEFVLEIEIITTLHHKNIISLLGFCFEDANGERVERQTRDRRRKKKMNHRFLEKKLSVNLVPESF